MGKMAAKKNKKPCDTPSAQKKHKNWRRCKWQFGSICLGYIDEKALEKNYAMYLDRSQVTDEMCKARFLPVDDAIVSGEQHYCRRPAAFVEIQTAKKIKRVRKETGEVISYHENLFGERIDELGLVARSADKQH